MAQRYITLWRKTGDKLLEWDNHVSESRDEAERVVKNITADGVHQYHTYQLGVFDPELSSRY